MPGCYFNGEKQLLVRHPLGKYIKIAMPSTISERLNYILFQCIHLKIIKQNIEKAFFNGEKSNE